MTSESSDCLIAWDTGSWKEYGFESREAYEDAVWKLLPQIGEKIREQDSFDCESNYNYLFDRKEELEEKYRYYDELMEMSTNQKEREQLYEILVDIQEQIEELEDQMSEEEPNYSDSENDIVYLNSN